MQRKSTGTILFLVNKNRKILKIGTKIYSFLLHSLMEYVRQPYAERRKLCRLYVSYIAQMDQYTTNTKLCNIAAACFQFSHVFVFLSWSFLIITSASTLSSSRSTPQIQQRSIINVYWPISVEGQKWRVVQDSFGRHQKQIESDEKNIIDKFVNNLKLGKAQGPDGLSAEHLVHAHPLIYLYLCISLRLLA